MIKKLLPFPFTLFALMFSNIFLLNLNYTILRSVRNTLAVTDLGGSALSIPYFELFGVLPAACLMTWGLSWIMRHFCSKSAFCIAMSLFITFFAGFTLILYPKLQMNHNPWLNQLSSMSFYVASELFKPAFIQILFWGLMNQKMSHINAKSVYPSLMLGASLGSIIAGPMIVGCTSLPKVAFEWGQSFQLIMCIVILSCITTIFLYAHLCHQIEKNSPLTTFSKKRESITLANAFRHCLKSPSLKLLITIVFADYIAYSLGEVLFFEILKLKYPNPIDYCRYQGYISSFSSVLTVFTALIFIPLCKAIRWERLAVVLPFVLLLTEGLFFVFLQVNPSILGWNREKWIVTLVLLGSLQYCLCRATKYTFFDCSKELAFAAFSEEENLSGKLIIDGIGSRAGRGFSSFLSLSFIALSGGILASSLITAIVAMGSVLGWIFATFELGKTLHKRPIEQANA